jgi:hypothetical protein
MTLTPILAHGGLDGIVKMFEGTAAATFIVIGALSLCVIGWVLRDLFRFGRDGFPWLLAVGVSALFGGVAFWIMGWFGALAGAPVLVAFGFGRHAVHRRRIDHD